MTRTPPTIEDLVRHPERVTEVARERGGSSQLATRLLTAPQVAEALGVPVSYVYELARTGRLPAVQFGKHVRFARRAVTETACGGATAGAR